MSKRQLVIAESVLVSTTAVARPAAPLAKRPRLSPPLTTVPSASLPSTPLSTSAIANSASTFAPSAYQAALATAGSSPTEADLLRLECETLDPSWLALLQDELKKPYFLSLKKFLWQEGLRGTTEKDDKGKAKVFPPARDVYSWSRYTPLEHVKVVILGQDPYHDDGQAHGLCFSVRPGVKIPPSLRNIYKEIKDEYPEFEVPKHGNLISLARSGVLMLNTSLTVKPHQAGSHSNKGWETFTDKIVELVDKYGGSSEVGKKSDGVVVLAWGAWAAKRVAKMDQKKHLILTSPHPSPLSARRGFFGNGHFRKANDWLEAKYGPEARVDWTKLDPEEEETGLQNAAQ
ncbi:hypothetical protein JCM1840_005447 [Sporobolomyces johnsonii]